MNWMTGWFCWWWVIFFVAGVLVGLYFARRYWLQQHREQVERHRHPRPRPNPATSK
jgi:hypothetical protein